jgi:RHS repeat-associated protein
MRLRRLRSEPRPNAGGTPSGPPFQDLGYTYDFMGNLLALDDRTPGAGIAPTPNRLTRTFTYDALYRLLSATGRETDVAIGAPWDDTPRSTDLSRARAYTETYTYDDVGGLLVVSHHTANGGSTTTFTPQPGSNRLATTTIGNLTYTYSYDAAGNQLTETTSRLFEWDHANRLTSFRTQTDGAAAPSRYAQYRYDAAGSRVIKLAQNQAGQQTITFYIDGLFERTIQIDGGAATNHDLIHLRHGASQLALLRVGDPLRGDPSPTVAYHLPDHLGSSNVVLDGSGALFNREEYTPYGVTSFGSYAHKRYRFTAKERDEETGLAYHGARYYAPWLCRWTACDPTPADLSESLYCYVSGRATCRTDPTGEQGQAAGDRPARPANDQVERSTNAGGFGYGLMHSTPAGFTLLVPDSYDFTKMYAYQRGVLRQEIARNAGPESPTSTRRNTPEQRQALAEHAATKPRPKDPAPGGRGWAQDHIVELQHDRTGQSRRFRWQDSRLNSTEGSQSWALQRNNPFGKPAGAVVRVSEGGRWYNSPEVRGFGNGLGTVLTLYGVYQSTSHIATAVQSDISHGSGAEHTARAVAHEAAGWAGALAGAEAAAPWGAVCGPVAWICVPAFGLGGGGLGFWAGSKATDTAIDVGQRLMR